MPVEAGDWPRWRGPKLDNISTEAGWQTEWPANGPKQLWKASVGVGYSTVAVSQGRLYTMGNTDNQDSVYCLEAGTGQEVWKHSYACNAKDPNGYHGTRCTPTVDDGLVYTVSREGHLFCLDAQKGAVVWKKNFKEDFQGKVPQWGFAGSPLIEKDLVLVEAGGPGANVVAMNKKTGEVVWKAGDDAASYSSIIPFDQEGQRALMIFNAFGLVAHSMKDGKELWRHPWKTSWNVNAATPVIEGNQVFISSGYNTGCALLEFGAGSAPKVVWQNKNMRNHVNSCILWKGYLYGFDENELRCLDWKTGQTKWAEKKYGKGSLMLAGGKFLVYSGSGRIAAASLSPEGCQEISGFQVLEGRDTWAYPVLANGKLYCRSLENLVGLDVSGKN